jgi:hypothetical protein
MDGWIRRTALPSRRPRAVGPDGSGEPSYRGRSPRRPRCTRQSKVDATVVPQDSLAIVDVMLRRPTGGFVEHPSDEDGIRIDPVHDPPDPVLIPDPDLMATRPDARHGPRMRHPQRFPLLEPAQQVPRLHSRLGREGRSLDLAAKPHERLPNGTFLLAGTHAFGLYVRTDIESNPLRGGSCRSCPGTMEGGRSRFGARTEQGGDTSLTPGRSGVDRAFQPEAVRSARSSGSGVGSESLTDADPTG